MNDLISRQQVIELLEYEIELMRGHLDNVNFADHNARKGFETAIEILEDDIKDIKDNKEFPSIPSEIVRCKNCCFYVVDKNFPWFGDCIYRDWGPIDYLPVVDENGWCYHGERKPKD